MQYPKKPIELADDLKSFVHVLQICALRFHHHDLATSYRLTDSQNISSRELAKKNQESNDSLAHFVDSVFYEEKEVGNYVIGGRQKLKQIAQGIPGFSLLDGKNGPTPLARLLIDLFALLREHYAALDVASLEHYKVSTQPVSLSPETTTVMLTAPNVDSFLQDESHNPSLRRQKPRPTRNTSTVHTTAGLANWPGPEPPLRVLDNHDAMSEAIWDVWQSPDGSAKVPMECLYDKTLDQLYGLMQYVAVRPSNPSTSGAIKLLRGEKPLC